MVKGDDTSNSKIILDKESTQWKPGVNDSHPLKTESALGNYDLASRFENQKIEF